MIFLCLAFQMKNIFQPKKDSKLKLSLQLQRNYHPRIEKYL